MVGATVGATVGGIGAMAGAMVPKVQSVHTKVQSVYNRRNGLTSLQQVSATSLRE